MSGTRDPDRGLPALEAALRRQAAARVEGPAPHVVPRVLATVAREEAAREATAAPARRRPAVGPLLALAASALVVVLAWGGGGSPADVPGPGAPPLAGAATPPAPAATEPLVLVGPPLRELPRSSVASLERALGDTVEEPLLQELDGLAVDAQRAAAVVVEPLLRALVDLQLRPSMDGAWDRR